MASNRKSTEVEVDKRQWSEPSKRSYTYVERASYYTEVAYRCLKCSTRAVFTAAEQKHAFEVKKRYIWQRRVLCANCYKKLHQLTLHERSLRQRWSEMSAAHKSDTIFIAEWLGVLVAQSCYGKRVNTAMANKLRKILGTLQT